MQHIALIPIVGLFLEFYRRVFKHARFTNILAELKRNKNHKEGEEENVGFQSYEKFIDERFLSTPPVPILTVFTVWPKNGTLF